jgi:hypothetical protein
VVGPLLTPDALVSWGAVLLLGAFALVVCWKLVSGVIELTGILEGDARDDLSPKKSTTYDSPGRAQAMAVTLFVAAYYLLLASNDRGRLPELPSELLAALAASHGVYLTGKAQAVFLGRFTHLLRRKP